MRVGCSSFVLVVLTGGLTYILRKIFSWKESSAQTMMKKKGGRASKRKSMAEMQNECYCMVDKKVAEGVILCNAISC